MTTTRTRFKTGANTLQPQDERLEQLKAWLSLQLEKPMQGMHRLLGDASFRRYFRVSCGDTSYIAMDAPPDQEACQPFVAIAKTFYALGLNVPIIYAEDIEQGFLLLTDFGDTLYLQALNETTCDPLYRSAMNDLLLIQSCQQIDNYVLPKFDGTLYRREMSWFRDWYLTEYLNVPLSAMEQESLEQMFSVLCEDALSQPQVCVHRDYHSRNLMVVEGTTRPGILDFQDAVWGPVTYDLMSLLRDCYIDWPSHQVAAWARIYQQQALQAGLLEMDDPREFMRWFDWIGLQRNLKCIGLFARLEIRDNKPTYLQYIPRILKYAQAVSQRYSEFSELLLFLNKKRSA